MGGKHLTGRLGTSLVPLGGHRFRSTRLRVTECRGCGGRMELGYGSWKGRPSSRLCGDCWSRLPRGVKRLLKGVPGKVGWALGLKLALKELSVGQGDAGEAARGPGVGEGEGASGAVSAP